MPDYDAIVIGAGFSGLAMLHHLREIGLRTLAVDGEDGIGGTWWVNRYPGVRTDSEYSYYSFSFSKEVRDEWTWTQRYPDGKEVLAYLNFVADRLDLRKDIRFGAFVEEASWDEATNLWNVRLADGTHLTATYLVSGMGVLSQAILPDIEGIETFAGESYHTAHWPEEGVDLKGKRVGFCPGTSSEYFLAIFLEANALAESEIRAVPLTPKDAHQALATGEVDALSGWQEIRAHADQALGRRTRIFYAEGTYLETWNLVGLAAYLQAQRQLVEGFVRALLKAQSFVATDAERAITITAAAIGIERPTIAEMWPDYAFDVGLDQALIANLKGHWRMAAKSDAGAPMPDFMADLAPAALQSVDPTRVPYLR